jgi:class 3 adenylate cyclase
MRSWAAQCTNLALAATLALGGADAHGSLPTSPAKLTAGPGAISLAGHVATLEDPGGELTLHDIRSGPWADQFDANDSTETFSRGYTPAAWWYRVRVRAPAESPDLANWVLELHWPVLDYLDVHISRSDGVTATLLTGDLRQPPAEQVRHREFAIPFQTRPGEELVIHVRVQSAGPHVFRMRIWPDAAFQAKAVTEHLAYGAFFGTLLLMAFYHLLVFAATRDRAYLYYVLLLASSTGLALCFSGYARAYGNSWSMGAAAGINFGLLLLNNTNFMFAWLFTREYLQTRTRAPRLHRLGSAMAAAYVLAILLYPLLGYASTDQLSDLLGLVTVAIMVPASFYLALKGHRAAQIYVVVWTFLLFGISCTILQGLGLLPSNAFTMNGWMIGIAFGMIAISMALTDRITQERKEKFAARHEALAVQERVKRLKGFLPQQVAELVVQEGRAGLLEPKRRKVTVCVIDLRGFTPFSETSAPEDVMAVLREFYAAMGAIVEKRAGAVEHFAGDSMLIFFNAPLEVANPEECAVRSALEMRAAFDGLQASWSRHGHELGLGIGIADGYATVGAIGFAGRSQYAAIGAVTNLASRLCSEAKHGEILTTARVLAAVGGAFETEDAGERTIRGFSRSVQVVRIIGAKPAAAGEAAPAAA